MTLWAALFFPQLTIDMADSCDTPLAMVTQQGTKRLLMSCNDPAREMGLHPGLALNSAYAVSPDLITIDYEENTQQQYIEQLSLWAMQYSSWVTPFMPDTVMLEVAASLKLFDGLKPLLEKIQQDSITQGLNLQIGVAPTPSAARLLSRTGNIFNDAPFFTHGMVAGFVDGEPDRHNLKEYLNSIPVEYLPLDNFTLKGLRQSGIKTCEQLFDLPATALTRRFGQTCTELVYKLLGKLPDPCPAFKAPEQFIQSLDLPLEAPDASALQFPLNRLLNSLGGFLRSSDLGVKMLQITLQHHRIEPSKVTLGFLEATADQKHLLKVASERLSATSLSAPATAITIEAKQLDDITRSGKDLFNKSESQSSSIEQAIDLLSARLGRDKIYTPAQYDDHRPEKAPRKITDTQSVQERSGPSYQCNPNSRWPARPLWLLKEPKIAERMLTLHSSAERIENGWWCLDDVRRDYYLAEDKDGAWYWVYTERRLLNATNPNELYIHGIFS